jgi:predicted MPP superfamily phosphohydrolase
LRYYGVGNTVYEKTLIGRGSRVAFFLFLLIFLTVYSGLHLYALLKVQAALSLGAGTLVVLVAYMAIMIISPIIVRISEGAGLDSTARILAHIGYIWMGLLFLFVSASLILDVYRLVVYAGEIVLPRPFSQMVLPPRYAFSIALTLSTTIMCYGYFEALDIRTSRVTLKSQKIPKEVGRLTIAQISDVHLGLIVGEKRLKRILEKVKAADPDILVSTGDLVDGQPDNLTALAEIFRNVKTRYGAFAVTGNHEYYAGLERSLGFTKQAGFRLLRGEGVTVSGLINIVGVNDPTEDRFGFGKAVSEKALLSGFPQDTFTLFLKHRPSINKEAVRFFDLQLSGHVHKGQIFPFRLIARLFYPKDAGLFELTQNARLYVSRGSGTWGPPVRFLAPPEVVVIELVHESKEEPNFPAAYFQR